MGSALFGPGARARRGGDSGVRHVGCLSGRRAGVRETVRTLQGARRMGGETHAGDTASWGRAEIGIRLWSGNFWEAIERRAERSTQYYVNCLSNWDRKLP